MSNLKVKDIALVVFLNSLLFVIVNLLTDLVLSLSGQPTISQHVWNQPLLGIPVMLPVLILPVSLVVHLFYR